MTQLTDRLERDLREIAAGAHPSPSAWEKIMARLGDGGELQVPPVLAPAPDRSKRGIEVLTTGNTALEVATLDLAAERSAPRQRRWWVVSAAALATAAATIAGIVVVTSDPDTLSPADESVSTTDPSVDNTVRETAPATAPSNPELFVDIAPGSMVDLPNAPINSPYDTAGVWTGTEMILWGGQLGNERVVVDGAAFNLANGTWRLIATAPLSSRREAAAVWTGNEMIVWSGFNAEGVRLYDGAAYNPTTDTWRILPPIPVSMGAGDQILSMVWTGDEAVVIGVSAAAYDPVTNTWRRLADPPAQGYPAMWTGESIVLMDTGMMRYDLATDSWSVKSIGSYAELVPIPGSERFKGGFVSLPSAIGAPTQLLDRAGDQISELPAFPGDPSLFGAEVEASGLAVGDEAIFWIWPSDPPWEPEQVWALNLTTQTWTQLDDALILGEDVRVIAGDVLLVWGDTGDRGNRGVAYRSGTSPS